MKRSVKRAKAREERRVDREAGNSQKPPGPSKYELKQRRLYGKLKGTGNAQGI